jgi:hypothetical protein
MSHETRFTRTNIEGMRESTEMAEKMPANITKVVNTGKSGYY